MKRIFLTVLLLVLGAAARAAVVTTNVEYKVGDTAFKCVLAYDGATTNARPGVLVIPEWWGNNDYSARRAKMLAELGYAALAVDMYGSGLIAETPDVAGQLSSEVKKNPDIRKARFGAAEKFLKSQPQVDPAKIAAIGYCFGGTIVLEAARDGEDLAGVVSFHGGLATTSPAKTNSVKARILVCHGEDDKFVSAAELKAFEDEMSNAGAKCKVTLYKDATHAFTNHDSDETGKKFNLPIRYNADADEQSWTEMKAFLREAFSAK